jgi:hypothetical protein
MPCVVNASGIIDEPSEQGLDLWFSGLTLPASGLYSPSAQNRPWPPLSMFNIILPLIMK